MNPEMWKKHPSPEKKLVALDWTKDLAGIGATLTGTPTITVIGDPLLSCTYIITEGNVMKFWLEGGDPLVEDQYVQIVSPNSTGENLMHRVRVIMSG